MRHFSGKSGANTPVNIDQPMTLREIWGGRNVVNWRPVLAL